MRLERAAQVWRIRNSHVLGQRPDEFRIQSHTSNSLNLVWFLDLKFPNVDATENFRNFKSTTLVTFVIP